MTDAYEAADRVEPASRPGPTDDVLGVAQVLNTTATVLSVPALVVASAATLGFVVVALVVGFALASEPTVAAWVVLALAVAGVVVSLVFVLRVRATLRAGRDRQALAADLLGLVDLREITTATLADLVELTSGGGGVRAVSRARALWRILRRLDVGEHTARFERAKWFVPPEAGTTWLLAQIVTWGGLVAWVLVPLAILARTTGVL